MWGNPGCPGHPDVEEQVAAMLQHVVDSEPCVKTDRAIRYRAKYRTEKWMCENVELALIFCVPVVLFLMVEYLLTDPKGLFTGS